jgi:hypothetical protein
MKAKGAPARVSLGGVGRQRLTDGLDRAGFLKNRDKIGTIVKSGTIYTCPLLPKAPKNGAPLLIRRVRGGSRKRYYLDVRPCVLAACDPEVSAASRAKMALWPLKKRHSAPIFHDFFDDFPRVFRRAFSSERKWARKGRRKR